MMPRVGAFEVSTVVCQNNPGQGAKVDPDQVGSQLVVFYSKIDFGLWPSLDAIANKIGQMMETMS